MVSKPVGKSAAAAKEYYYDKAPEGAREEAIWYGKAAEHFGLQQGQTVDRATWNQVVDGIHPETGERFREAPRTGEERAVFDLTFSAPKSFTLAALHRESLAPLHREAVLRSLDLLQDRGQATIQVDGRKVVVDTKNMLFSLHGHIESRNGDPQYHDHVLVHNVTVCEDGKTRALNNAELYSLYKTLGVVYRAELGQLVQDRAGLAVEITDRNQFFWEIKGFDREMVEAFSSRRGEILEVYRELKESGKYAHATDAQLKDLANLLTRKDKEELDFSQALPAWREATAVYGGVTMEERLEGARLAREAQVAELAQRGTLSPEAREAGFGQHADAPRNGINTSSPLHGFLREAAADLCEQESAWRQESVLVGAIKLAGLAEHKYTVKDLEGAYKDLVASGEIVSLGQVEPGRDKKFGVYTTPEMLRAEARTVARVEASKGTGQAIMTEQEAREGIARIEARRTEEGRERLLTEGKSPEAAAKFAYRLTDGQHALAMQALAGVDPVSLAQGDAGTGKTAALSVIKELAAEKNVDVIGVGFSTKSKVEMVGAGITAHTLSSFNARSLKITAPGGQADLSAGVNTIPRGTLVVVDEASMAPSLLLDATTELAARGDVRMLVAGDRKQLPSVGAGRLFVELLDRTTVAQTHLTEAQRQRHGTDAWHVAQAYKNGGEHAVQAAIATMVSPSRTAAEGHQAVLKSLERPEYEIAREGMVVKAADRGNHGTVAGIEGDKILVAFENAKTGASLTRTMEPGELQAKESGARLALNSEHAKELRAADALTMPPAAGKPYADSMLHQYADLQSRLAAATDAYIEGHQAGRETIIVTDVNVNRIALNASIRERLVEAGEVEQGRAYTVLPPANVRAPEIANSYREGMILNVIDRIKPGLGAGAQGTIVDVDNDRNRLTLEVAGGDRHTIDIGVQHGKIRAHEVAERNFGAGDPVVFLKKDDKIGVANGDWGKIVGVDERGNATVDLGSREVKVRLTEEGGHAKGDAPYMPYVESAYAVTTFKSQGGSYENVIYVLGDLHQGQGSRQAFYVAITRSKDGFQAFVPSAEQFVSEVSGEVQKLSTLGKELSPENLQRLNDELAAGKVPEEAIKVLGLRQAEQERSSNRDTMAEPTKAPEIDKGISGEAAKPAAIEAGKAAGIEPGREPSESSSQRDLAAEVSAMREGLASRPQPVATREHDLADDRPSHSQNKESSREVSNQPAPARHVERGYEMER